MFRNDPDLGAIPAVGKGSVDIGKRTSVGEAVIYDGTDPDALITFLGDEAIRNIAGELYRASVDGVLTPMVKLALPALIVRPSAGDWFTISEDQLRQEYAIHVNVPSAQAATGGGAGGGSGTPMIHMTPIGSTISVTHAVPRSHASGTTDGDGKKAPAKKAPAKKAAAKK